MKDLQTITVGGGCFWCTEAIFQRIKGIEKIVSGYTAGHTIDPRYKDICSGTTGHAEVIQLTFDENIITLKEVITIFMTTHDPTTLNQQGADRGTQYRSIICVENAVQRKVAEEVFSELASAFENPIVTEIVDLDIFYPAEQYHQSYYNRNRYAGYCRIVIDPKIQKLREKLGHLYKEI